MPDWFEAAKRWDLQQTSCISPISVIQLGEVGLLFHPAELYSYYGLEIRRDSPFEHTLVIGYTDDFIGYLTDPKAYQTGEYAAIVVPKITDLPLFTAEAARVLPWRLRCFYKSSGLAKKNTILRRGNFIHRDSERIIWVRELLAFQLPPSDS